MGADDDSGPGRVDRDAKLVRHPLDFDVADTGMGELLLQIALQLQVFVEQPAVVALCEPARAPGLGDSEPESVRMCLLTHYSLSPSSMVMWHVRR